VDVLAMWIDESYRAIAPKRLVARLEGMPAPRARRPSRAGRTASRGV
jgi:hypothetical protein